MLHVWHPGSRKVRPLPSDSKPLNDVYARLALSEVCAEKNWCFLHGARYNAIDGRRNSSNPHRVFAQLVFWKSIFPIPRVGVVIDGISPVDVFRASLRLHALEC